MSEPTGPTLPASPHFDLHEVAAGVWAAIARRDGVGAAVGNAAIVDLGDRALVFDTCWTPQAAADLRAAAERLTGHPVAYAVNSHRHGDHVFGNPIFADVPILATERTRAGIAEKTAPVLEWGRQNGEEYLRSLEAELAAAPPDRRERAAVRLGEARVFAAALPTLEIGLPTLVFDRQVTLHGPRRSARLLTFGGGHTDSDSLLYLPDARVAILGDLLTIANHPWLGDGDPAEWLIILERIAALDVAVAVPGHGPVGTVADFDPIREYLTTVQALVAQAVAAGQSAEEDAAQPVPAPFAAWAVPEQWASNIAALHARATGTRDEE
jgi:glyoxylase-like metal-dependent hydrolase (beta-lactamase superfamily II)